jgi:hypothetical protein
MEQKIMIVPYSSFLGHTRRNLKMNNWICDSFIVVMDTCD